MRAEDIDFARLDVVVTDLEAFVDRFDLRLVVRAQDRFVEVLQQDVVDFAQAQHVTVVVVHELLHTELCVAVLVP
jgi:hypothetical protein